MHAKNNLFMIKSPLIRQAVIRSGMMHVASDELANRLAAIAESFYIARDFEQLREAAGLLSSLPEPKAQVAGLYYRAMCEGSKRDDERAARLLWLVTSSDDAPRFKARAFQALGIIHRYANDNAQAAELYQRAIRQAEKCQDFVTVIRAGMTIAELSTSKGDHRTSLKHLEAIRPAIEVSARVAPFYIPAWCNDVAIDLAGLGRIEEARRFAQFAINSPYSRAYPEWLETAQEIEQARESIPAHKSILRAVARPAMSTATKRTPRTLFLVLKLVLKASRRRLQPRTAIFTRELPHIRPTLEQVSLKIKIRAPSF